MIWRSFLYGWLGAIIAGVLVAVCAVVLGIPEDRMVAISTPAGVLFGVVGLSLPWTQRLAHARAARGRRGGK